MLDARGRDAPVVVHWGADLGPLSVDELVAISDATVPAVPPSSVDAPLRASILPVLAEGWTGIPAVATVRDSQTCNLHFRQVGIDANENGVLVVDVADEQTGVAVRVRYELCASGLLLVDQEIRNNSDAALCVARSMVTLPVPAAAQEVLDFGGRWAAERRPQRHRLEQGALVRQTRHGRTGHDSPFVMVAGTPGFGFRRGEVWAVHVGWSGDHELSAQSAQPVQTVLSAGERLDLGEVTLAPGAVYRSPRVFGAHAAEGLDAVSGQFHSWVRQGWADPAMPDREPRVVLNTWEAVYFQHDEARLLELAELAADVGVERFVLDDGWMSGRIDDQRSLGDWSVDSRRWPRGLHPLVERVIGLGMDFGLWVEPEMVSLDSDLARAHPDWMLRDSSGRLPPAWRHQYTVDLANPAAFANVRDQLLALLGEYPISFLKWDQNRDLLLGRSHRQTGATYRLMDELLARHPGLEIESCSSGGARVDLGVLQRVRRVWASDTLDPLQRQAVQRWTTLLVPPELMGSHVGGPVAHTTGRGSSLSLRTATASFAAAGIEWDLTGTTPVERDALRSWIRWYKEMRGLITSGTIVRSDPADDGLWVHGIVAADGSEAYFQIVAENALRSATPAPLRLPGLAALSPYRISTVEIPGLNSPVQQAFSDLHGDELRLPGSAVTSTGFTLPPMSPGDVLLLRAVRAQPAPANT